MTGWRSIAQAHGRGFGRPAALAALAVATAACVVAPSPVPSAGPATPPAPQVTPNALVSRAPESSLTIDPEVLFTTDVTCGDGIEFAADRLRAQGDAGWGTDVAAGRFRTFLAGPDRLAADLPATGWIRIDVPPTDVLFMAPNADGWLQVGLELKAGVWTVDRYGGCRLRPNLPDGIGPAQWWLDPRAAAPGPEATEITGLLEEMSCASGRSPEGRIVGPAIIEQPGRVVAMFAVRGQPGDQDCQGNAPLAVRFSLPSPLGTRRLFDGGAVPPRDATVPGL